MIDQDSLVTSLLAVLEEQKWKTRMLPPLEIATPSDEDLVAAQEYARADGFIGELWGQIVEEIRTPSDELTEELTDEYRGKELARFVASIWIAIITTARKRGMTGLDENSLPVPSHADLARAWNDGAPQFGLTGQDFSDFVGEALTRMRSRGDSITP